MLMKQTEEFKELYETPAIMVVEMKTEGVICASDGSAGTQNYNWHTPGEE